MGVCDKFVDLSFVIFEEGVDMFFVDDVSVLCLGKNEVQQEDELEVVVEGNLDKDEVELGFNQKVIVEDDLIYELWCKLGGVGCF